MYRPQGPSAETGFSGAWRRRAAQWLLYLVLIGLCVRRRRRNVAFLPRAPECLLSALVASQLPPQPWWLKHLRQKLEQAPARVGISRYRELRWFGCQRDCGTQFFVGELGADGKMSRGRRRWWFLAILPFGHLGPSPPLSFFGQYYPLFVLSKGAFYIQVVNSHSLNTWRGIRREPHPTPMDEVWATAIVWSCVNDPAFQNELQQSQWIKSSYKNRHIKQTGKVV